MIAITVIPVMASHETVEKPVDECRFYTYIEKSIRQWSERPQIFGFVSDECREFATSYDSHKVHVKVIDQSGNLVADNWIPKARAQDPDVKPQLYEFDGMIQEIGVRLDNQYGEDFKVYPNWYNVYIPLLNTIDFRSYEAYTVQVTYGNMTNEVLFLIAD